MQHHAFLLCYIWSVIAAVNAQVYTLNATIPWHPKAPSSVDQSLIYNNTYYLSDRTNAGVQVISLTNDSQITIIKGFTTTIVNNTLVKTESGPNGLTVIPDRNELYATDAHGIVKVIDLFSLEIVANISIGGVKRADEIGYDPTTSTAVISNGDDDTPFVAIVNTTTQALLGTVMFPNATGLEQPTINPADSKFYVAVDSNPTYPGGAIAVLDLSNPTNFSVASYLPLSGCIPGGIVFGATNQLFVSCSGSQFSTFGFEASYIIDVTTGDVKANISGVSGVDQVAYSPATTYFYATAYQDETSSGSPAPYLFVIAANGTIVQKITTDNVTAHSVAVEAGTGTLAVPVKSKGVMVYDLTSGSSSTTNASSTATGGAATASATSGAQNVLGNMVAVLSAACLAALMIL